MDTDTLLKKRAEQTITPQDYEALVHEVGSFTKAQLLTVLKTGQADRLREDARDELIARAAVTPHWSATWTFWLVVLGIAISLLAWLFPR